MVLKEPFLCRICQLLPLWFWTNTAALRRATSSPVPHLPSQHGDAQVPTQTGALSRALTWHPPTSWNQAPATFTQDWAKHEVITDFDIFPPSSTLKVQCVCVSKVTLSYLTHSGTRISRNHIKIVLGEKLERLSKVYIWLKHSWNMK